MSPLERLFLALVVTSGLVLFLVANTLVQDSFTQSSDMIRQYLAARRALRGRQDQEMVQSQQVLDNLVQGGWGSSGSGEKLKRSDEGGGGGGGRGSTVVPGVKPGLTTKPITDPPWMEDDRGRYGVYLGHQADNTGQGGGGSGGGLQVVRDLTDDKGPGKNNNNARAQVDKGPTNDNALMKGLQAHKLGQGDTRDPHLASGGLPGTPPPPFVPRADQHHPFLRGYVIENPDVCKAGAGADGAGAWPKRAGGLAQPVVVDVLILIHSDAPNLQRRRGLRETWAGTGTVDGVILRRVFLLGRDGQDNRTQVRINTEQATFGDVVQGDFLDTAHNRTLKAVTGLRWLNDHCRAARFIVKADDDAFVHVFSLLETYLQRLHGRNRSVMCHHHPPRTMRLDRNARSQYYVPLDTLKGQEYWQEFCSGYLVAMTPDVASLLYEASFSATTYVTIADAFVYGILPTLGQKGKTYLLNYIDIAPNLVQGEKRLLGQYSDPKRPPLTYLGGGGVSGGDAMFKLWQAVLLRLSPWAERRASITRLRGTMTPKIL